MKLQNELTKRVKDRLRGAVALMLSLVLMMTMLPAIQAKAYSIPEVVLQQGDNFYFIVNNSYDNGFFCTGQETLQGKTPYDVLDYSVNKDDNGYVRYYSGFKMSRQSPLNKVSDIQYSGFDLSATAIVTTDHDATVYCGSVNESGGVILELWLDGEKKTQSLNSGSDNRGSFTLPAGKYEVWDPYGYRDYGDGDYRKRIEFRTKIESLTLSPDPLEMTLADDPVKLTVTPAAAQNKVKWTSSDEKIAKVDDSGAVTPVSAGEAKITATYTEDVSITATCVVKISKTAIKVTPPTAKTLTYTGSAQELVEAGKAEGGTMQYAIGTDAKTPPTSGYSTSIPTGTNAGTYYVWYKAVGDADHNDSEAKCVTASIQEKKTDPGTQTDTQIEIKVEKKEDIPTTTVEGLTKDIAKGIATDEEKAAINSGQDAVLSLEITNIDQTVSTTDKQIMENAAVAITPRAKVGMYLDFSMFFQVGNLAVRKVSDLNGGSISVKVEVPKTMKAAAGVKRTFYLLSIHNNISKVLGSSTTDTIPATITEFSTYAIAYADESQSELFFTSISVKQSNGKIKISWDKTDAKKVEVYMTYCGQQYPSKPVKTTGGTSVTIKKLNGKKLNFKKNFKLYLVGYGSDGNRIGKTVSSHFVGKDNKKQTNVKSINVKNASVTLTKGQSTKVSASVKLENKKKKMLSDGHAAKFRFASTNIAVATVDENGNITGVGAGTCDVYVFAVNGLAKKVAVTVTE